MPRSKGSKNKPRKYKEPILLTKTEQDLTMMYLQMMFDIVRKATERDMMKTLQKVVKEKRKPKK